MDKNEYRYQTEEVSLPAGTSGSIVREITLDSSYERCVGLALFPSKDGGLGSYKVGLEDNSRSYVDLVNRDLLVSSPSAGLETDKRFLKTNIRAQGHKVKLTISLAEATVSPLALDFTFRLERNEKR